MATVTGYMEGYVPVSPTAYYTPVQDETPIAAAGLCGAPMPDGRGILVWTNGSNARFAVTASCSVWLGNDVVPSADMDTIISGSVRSVSVYNIDGQIYATIIRLTTSCIVDIYKADDPTDPYAGWTLQSTPMNTPAPGTWFGQTRWAAGIPIQLESGRWVMACGGWQNGLSPAEGASGCAMCAWYSDNGPAGPWTLTLNHAHIGAGFPRVEFTSNQIGRDPITGYLYCASSGAGGNDNTRLWWSQDNGATTTSADSGFILSVPRLNPFINNGTTLYSSLNDTPALLGELAGPGNDFDSWVSVSENYSPTNNGDNATFRGVPVVGEGMYYFWNDHVSFQEVIVQVLPYPPLHIPYKDRLKDAYYQPSD